MKCRSLLLILLVSLYSTAASAACTQGDITGVWRVYVMGTTTAAAYWNRCLVSVVSTGAIKTTSYCIDHNGAKVFFSGGALKVSSTCNITGTALFPGDRNTITDVQLSRDKITFAGVGRGSNDIFMFHGVKR